MSSPPLALFAYVLFVTQMLQQACSQTTPVLNHYAVGYRWGLWNTLLRSGDGSREIMQTKAYLHGFELSCDASSIDGMALISGWDAAEGRRFSFYVDMRHANKRTVDMIVGVDNNTKIAGVITSLLAACQSANSVLHFNQTAILNNLGQPGVQSHKLLSVNANMCAHGEPNVFGGWQNNTLFDGPASVNYRTQVKRTRNGDTFDFTVEVEARYGTKFGESTFWHVLFCDAKGYIATGTFEKLTTRLMGVPIGTERRYDYFTIPYCSDQSNMVCSNPRVTVALMGVDSPKVNTNNRLAHRIMVDVDGQGSSTFSANFNTWNKNAVDWARMMWIAVCDGYYGLRTVRSSNPTVQPTSTPTMTPSLQPTDSPSSAPTMLPTTGVPTRTPSTVPTSAPTGQPTVGPSAAPTSGLSGVPTQGGTIINVVLQAVPEWVLIATVILFGICVVAFICLAIACVRIKRRKKQEATPDADSDDIERRRLVHTPSVSAPDDDLEIVVPNVRPSSSVESDVIEEWQRPCDPSEEDQKAAVELARKKGGHLHIAVSFLPRASLVKLNYSEEEQQCILNAINSVGVVDLDLAFEEHGRVVKGLLVIAARKPITPQLLPPSLGSQRVWSRAPPTDEDMKEAVTALVERGGDLHLVVKVFDKRSLENLNYSPEEQQAILNDIDFKVAVCDGMLDLNNEEDQRKVDSLLTMMVSTP